MNFLLGCVNELRNKWCLDTIKDRVIMVMRTSSLFREFFPESLEEPRLPKAPEATLAPPKPVETPEPLVTERPPPEAPEAVKLTKKKRARKKASSKKNFK